MEKKAKYEFINKPVRNQVHKSHYVKVICPVCKNNLAYRYSLFGNKKDLFLRCDECLSVFKLKRI